MGSRAEAATSSGIRPGGQEARLQAVEGRENALLRDGDSGPDRLSEEADPQFFDHPPDPVDVVAIPRCPADLSKHLLIVLAYAPHRFHPAGVATNICQRP